MTKQIFDKIYEGKALNQKILSADEKKVLYDAMVKHGMSQSTAYLRFFDKGFDQWEILGVTKLREEFLLTAVPTDDNDEGARGYAYVLSLAEDYDDSKFYDLITELKLGVKLCDFMAERGMVSSNTVRNRFKSNDWKPWELRGVKSILDELEK